MASPILWALFVLFIILTIPLHLRAIHPILFIILIVGASFTNYTNYVDMPTPVFWILVVLLLPFLLLPASYTNVLLYILIIPYMKLMVNDPDSLPPWVMRVFPVAFWILWVLVWPLATFMMYGPSHFSISSVGCWMVMTILLHDEIHFLMSIVYWVTWPIMWSTLLFSLPPNLPPSWHIICLSSILISGLGIRPDLSLVRFILWSIYVIVATPLLRIFFNHLFIYPEKYIFPYNLISGDWKISSQRWYPAGERSDLASVLCTRCTHFTAKSKLIMGSNHPLTRLVEWHEFWDSFEELRHSAVDLQCRLCDLLWHSIGEERQHEIAVSPASDDIAISLKVRIWEQRPLSQYTFAQLYQGKSAVGRRLLIHRGNKFGDSSPACKSPSTESDQHIQQAKSWIENCKSHHRRCNGVGNQKRELPTRLIHITSASFPELSLSPAIKIQIVDPADRGIEYVAFSHCWGASKPFRLLEDNIESCLQNLEFSKLSKNVQDAIQITHRLGYSYLWVDSLCIIQDSEEDWKAEASTMGDVYAGAVCTIASTGSSSSEGGCYHDRRTLSLDSCKIGASSLDELLPTWIYIRRDDLSDFRRDVDRSPLNNRGWVLQERLLSRRILHFGAEMLYWECGQRVASELNARGYIYKSYPVEFGGNFILSNQDRPWTRNEIIIRRLPPPEFGFNPSDHLIAQNGRGFLKENLRSSIEPWSSDLDNSRYRSALDKLQSNIFWTDVVGMSSFSHCWYEIVESYTRSQLTFSKDKLVAISGLVQQVKSATKFVCLAGLWQQRLATDLLWFAGEGPGHRLFASTQPTPRFVEVAEEVLPSQHTEEASPKPAEDSADSTTEHYQPVQGEYNQVTDGEHHQLTELGPKRLVYMAPSWSWASIDGVVTIDLLAPSAMSKISGKSLISILGVTLNYVQSGQTGKTGDALEGFLEIKGPLSRIANVQSNGEAERRTWFVRLDDNGYLSARLFPDVEDDISQADELFCLSCIALNKEPDDRVLRINIREVQGLVLRRREKGDGSPDLFERVGFFTTNLMGKSSSDRKRLEKATEKVVYIV